MTLNIVQVRAAYNHAIAQSLVTMKLNQELSYKALDKFQDDMIADTNFYEEHSEDLREAISLTIDLMVHIQKLCEAYPMPKCEGTRLLNEDINSDISNEMTDLSGFKQVPIEHMHQAMGQY